MPRRLFLGCEPRSRLSAPPGLLLILASIKLLGPERVKGIEDSDCLARVQHRHRQLQRLASVISEERYSGMSAAGSAIEAVVPRPYYNQDHVLLYPAGDVTSYRSQRLHY
jgi:hypothetical protein